VRSREGTFQTTAVRPGALTELLAQLVQPDGERPSAGWDLPLEAGESIGRFEILREVGRGGFGVVYEARDSELGRSVAFKAVRTSGLTELKADRLLAEAEAAARLAHPNIVHLYDLGRCERGAFLILELLKGKTLAERLEEGPLPAREALRVAVEAARGLAHAHAQGVVHRDLKPGNVFLCEDGQVKLLDFGLAHVFGKGGTKGGTPAYMAPEQAKGEVGDETSDVFGLGVMLFELLSGKLPFPDGEKGIPEGAKAPTAEGASAALDRLLRRMLARDPEKRPATGEEAYQALSAIQKSLEPRRGLRVAVLVAAGAVVGAGIFAWAWQRPLPPGRLLTVLADTDNSTGDPDLDGVSELLRAGLEQSKRVAVMGRARLVGILREAGGELPGTIGEAESRAAAKKAGAKLLVVPAIRPAAGGYHVAVRAVDVERNQTIFSLRESAAAKATVPAALDRILGEARTALNEEPGQAPAAPVAVETVAPANPEALRHYTQGTRLRSEGRHDEALEPFMKAVAADPDFVPPRLAILEDAMWERSEAMHWEDAKVDSFLSALRQGLHRLPAKERAYADVVIGSFPRFNWAESFVSLTDDLRQADRIIDASPDDPRPYVDAAQFHLDQRGDLEPARPYVEKAIPLVPHDDSHPVFVRFLLAIGRLDEALARARRVAEAVPSPASLQQLAMAHRVRGETAEALGVARRAAARFPDDVLWWTFAEADALDEADRLGDGAMRRPRWLALGGRVRDALRAYDALRRAAPNSWRASIHLHFQRGFLLLAREQPGAVWLETEATFRGGAPAHILSCDAWKLALLGDLQHARRLEMMARDRVVCGRMASALLRWRAGDREAALGFLAAIAAPSSDLNRGEILSEMGRDREAVDLFRAYRRRRALNVWDSLYDIYNYPRSLYLEAATLERLGEGDEARKVLGRFLRLWDRADAELPLLAKAKALRKKLAEGR
jgi:tetratricopeptide (TPR) repeat protein